MNITGFDISILEWIRNTLWNPVLDKIMVAITSLGYKGILWIAVAVIMLFFKRTRKTGLKLGVALILGLAIGNGIIKNVVARQRPYDYQAAHGVDIPLLIAKLKDFSFPSGHTLSCFEAAGVLMICERKRFGWAALVLAILISFSRLYLYVHYPTDVLAGIVLGLIFAVLGCLIIDAIWKLVQKKTADKKSA
ncbi:MAG: phosphatase PAP2 family protein [Clostridia bacterium]|nr:phosphatase PAP2 family protein [Clostridia bacterium]MBR6289821.1 phosphatase PAP2 family protein [Clostridia bacterium]